jgi:hypothetical protein
MSEREVQHADAELVLVRDGELDRLDDIDDVAGAIRAQTFKLIRDAPGAIPTYAEPSVDCDPLPEPPMMLATCVPCP